MIKIDKLTENDIFAMCHGKTVREILTHIQKNIAPEYDIAEAIAFIFYWLGQETSILKDDTKTPLIVGNPEDPSEN